MLVRVLYNDSLHLLGNPDETAIPGARYSTGITPHQQPAYDRWRTAHHHPDDPMLEVLRFKAPDDEWRKRGTRLRNRVFECLTYCHPDGWPFRSMCVGDVVLIQDKHIATTYALNPVGWTGTSVTGVILQSEMHKYDSPPWATVQS